MLFQTLDDKRDCVGYYYNNKLLFNHELEENLTKTWKYSLHMGDRELQIASLYCQGKSLNDVCPEDLKEKWQKASRKLKAFMRSFIEAKVSLKENCFFDLVPERFLVEYCEVKNLITKHVLENYPKPDNYDFLYDLARMLEEIKYQQLSITKEPWKYWGAKMHKRMSKISPYIAYNAFGTVTGRLGVQTGSFPILNIAREARRAILPSNDCFLELDFNAAELRVLLALNGKEQPVIDIHEWNAKNIFKKDLSRDEIKKRTFSWLYNPKAIDKSLEVCYNKNYVLKEHFNGEAVKTIFDREIKADDHHALNYIIQSTTSDLFLKQAIKIWKLLKGKKTHVAFTIHDSLVLDFHLSDKGMVEGLLEEFSNTELGKFKVNISGGKNFGQMREMKL
jgi:hypothetical protein